MIINNFGVIKQAIEKNGRMLQSIVAIEEMAELTKELTKAMRGMENHNAIVEEMADVNICLMEIRDMYNVNDGELQDAINGKLNRLRERLNHEEREN